MTAAIGLLVRWLLISLLGERVPFITLFPAVAFSAMFGGFGAGLATTLLGALAVHFFIMSPQNGFSLSNPVRHRADDFVSHDGRFY